MKEPPTPAPRLTVELVPRTCWYSNVRTNVKASEWNKCKAFVRERSGDRCEVCGGRGQRWPVECHEVWDYDDEKGIQRLEGLIALCPRCHEVKHIGRAEAIGRLAPAKEHLAKVNKWKPSEVTDYLLSCFALWDVRSGRAWELDISYLTEVLGP